MTYTLKKKIVKTLTKRSVHDCWKRQCLPEPMVQVVFSSLHCEREGGVWVGLFSADPDVVAAIESQRAAALDKLRNCVLVFEDEPVDERPKRR